MKVSLNWVKEFIDFELPPIDELVEKIGAQLGAVEEVIDLGKKYQGIIVAKVVSCEKHPDADKLSLCKIDDGGAVKDIERDNDGHVQVVCGAPNVREGLLVAWLPPGTTVPDTIGKEPLVLEAREIRGQKSNGMLASAKELAIGDSHAGLLVVDYDCLPGADFAEIYKLDDYVIDIENKMFTHRPDCFGILGVAREIAGICGHQFKSPDWYTTFTEKLTPFGSELPLEIKNELPDQVPRYMAVVVSNIEIAPSSVWIQSFLSRVGIRPIDNIVDATNYMMMLTGQPLHAYDYDKVLAQDPGATTATLTIRNPHAGEKLTLLNGKEIEPRPEAILIATATKAIGLGGVMGGAATEIDDNTKNIILECASFDMYSIRRTSMANGIFTDAVTRFNKGQSPLQNDRVIMQSAEMLLIGTAEYASKLIDDNRMPDETRQRNSVHPAVVVDTGFINARLGLSITDKDVETLLGNVEFHVSMNDSKRFIMAPFWRTDIELREDIVEEVGRLYGYDKLPLELPKRDLTPTAKDPLLTLKTQVRQKLSAAGANELLTYSFVHGDLLEKVGQDPAKAFQISNALSPDLQYYRISLVPSLLEKVYPNIKAGYDEFALFEIGKTHSLDHPDDDDGLPAEFEFTALVVAAADKLKKTGSPYYQARKYLSDLAGAELEFKPIGENMKQYPVVQPYNLDRSALVSVKSSGEFLGIIGEFKPGVARGLKLPKYCAGFEVDTKVLRTVLDDANKYVALPRFPKLTQDITLKVPDGLSYQELHDFILAQAGQGRPDNTLINLVPVDIYQKADDPDHKQVTLRLTIASYDRTLTDTEVNKLLDTVAAAAQAKLSAERI